MRIVPRDNQSANADRLLNGKTHGVIGYRIDLAKDLGGPSSEILEAGCSIGHIKLRFQERFPHIQSFQLGKLGGILSNSVGDLEEHATALLAGGLSPATLRKRPLMMDGASIPCDG